MIRALAGPVRFAAVAMVYFAFCAVPEAKEKPVKILAHYMPWFRAETMPDGQIKWEHWEWFGRGPKHDPDQRTADDRRDIASVFYPLIGPYDSRDPAVLEYHFLTAHAAGIEGFVVDWYGPDTYSDQVFRLLVQEAERQGMKVAICLEEKSFFPGYSQAQSREDVLDVAEKQIRYILDTYAHLTAYLHERNRPVLYMFVNHDRGVLGKHVLSPEELKNLLDRFDSSPVCFVRGHAEAGYAGIVDGAYAWVGDAAYRSNFYAAADVQQSSGLIDLRVGVALPGFDDHGVWGWGNGPRLIERRGTDEYDGHWSEVEQHRPNAVQIATWNDFQEGSTIEPAVEYGFTFVDRTEEWVARINGRKAYLTDNQWAYRLYVLRKELASIDRQDTRDALAKKLDSFARDLAGGRRLFMSYRLGRLEKSVQKNAGNSGDIE